MKGFIFTEFLELVEDRFGLDVLDDILEASDLPSGGAYTAVGTYDFNEMVILLGHLGRITGIDTGDLLYTFGLYLFDGLHHSHPWVISNYKSPMPLLMAIEDHIHVHVRKLYPDAILPSFEVEQVAANKLVMIYKSDKGLYRLAEGLIEKAFIHFQQTATVSFTVLKQDGTEVKFEITGNDN